MIADVDIEPPDGWLPRVKPEHGLARTAGGAVRIGGGVFGIAAEVEDGTGSVFTLLSAADGTNTVDQIVAAVTARHPDERPERVEAALRTFFTAGYLHDARDTPHPELSARERERQDRSRRFYRWIDLGPRRDDWEPLALIRRSRMVVIGLGGTGSAAALALAATGVGNLRCVDDDTVELTNLNRQLLYTEDDIGSPKVTVAVERLRRLNSGIDIEGHRRRIRSAEDLLAVLDGCDVVVLCADDPPELRSLVNRVCLATGTPWVDSGYHGPVVRSVAFVPGSGPCHRCLQLRDAERRPPVEGRQMPAPAASLATSANLSGHLAAHLALSVVTGLPPVRPGVAQGINLFAPDQHIFIEDARHPACDACVQP